MCHYSSISYIFVHFLHHVSLPGRDLEIGRFILVDHVYGDEASAGFFC